MVPRARLELARLAAVDFESTASTDSATEAIKSAHCKMRFFCGQGFFKKNFS